MIGPILEAMTTGERLAAVQLTNLSKASRRMLQIWDQLTFCDGVLCRRYEADDSSSMIAQVIVPKALRDEVLADLHEGTLGGHLRVEKTLAWLKEHFNWQDTIRMSVTGVTTVVFVQRERVQHPKPGQP